MPALVLAQRTFPPATHHGRHGGGRATARLLLGLGIACTALIQPAHASAQARGRNLLPAEVLTVLSRRDLTFGTLERGFAATISALDDTHAALFEIQGPADMSVRIELVLPAALESPDGGQVSLSFGPGDGFAGVSNAHPPAGTVFNPRAPLIAQLGPTGRLYLRIGGTARPDRLQTSGAYRAAIHVSLYNLGS